MQIATLQFGKLEISEDQVITFPKGLLGFEQVKKYALITRDDCKPFCWLQALDVPELSFVLVPPTIFFPKYHVEVNAPEVADIDVKDPNDVDILVIVTIPENMEEMTANLQGPLLINHANNIAKQMVITNGEYGIQHSIVRRLQCKAESGNLREQRQKVSTP